MRTIVLLGAPGAGKGTQAKKIEQELNVPHISTGSIFRTNISNNTELGQVAQRYISQGNLVPDAITNKMVAQCLAEPKCANGFILDGYPRTLAQAEALSDIIDQRPYDLDGVIDIEIDEEEIIDRLLKRAEIEGRADDTREVIENRLKVYHDKTEPLLNYYRERDMLVSVNGSGTIDQVWERIKPHLSA